jgi:glycosyltransferase involved in cell wall biosynthesis
MQTKNHIQIAALTGGLNTPSARFRVRQYIPYLRKHGIEVAEHIPHWGESCGLPSPFKMVSRIPGLIRSRRADLVWISRDLVQGYATFERMVRRPRILDVDDAIWLSRPLGKYGQPWVARGMDAVIAGNDYLANYYSRYCRTIYVLPTAIDTERYTPKPSAADGTDRFVIGWTGLRSNYKYLEMIEPALKRFLSEHRDVQLMLVSNQPWNSSLIPTDQIHFCPWTPENEASLLHRMTVGLMPLPDQPWTRGKCSFKMLQYMASALPVIVSPVGMNQQVLEKGQVGLAARTEDQWLEALESLYRDHALCRKMGQTGRQVVEKHYAVHIVADKLADIFRIHSR